jgi:transposase
VKGFEHETDVATLREALRLLALENERLTKLNLELQKALAEAKGERVEQLELEIAQLQQTVAARNQALFGDSSERRPSSAGPAAKQPQKQSGHGPRKQVLPLVERVHELDVADRTCTSCGGALSEWVGQFEIANEIDMVERHFVELVHKRKKYRCKCGGCIETAPAPPKLMPGGRYSIDIAISIAVGKYGNHMPLERTARALAQQGLVIDSQTLWDQIKRVGAHPFACARRAASVGAGRAGDRCG